jgi:hypothetical protein
VEVFTTLDKRLKTKVMKNNLNPVWEESFFLPVLERDQVLRLEVFDHDAVNLTGAMTLQVGQGTGDSMLRVERTGAVLIRACVGAYCATCCWSCQLLQGTRHAGPSPLL